MALEDIVLDTIKDEIWTLKAVRKDPERYTDRTERFTVQAYAGGRKYPVFDFGTHKNKGNFDALWKKVKAAKSIDDWLKAHYWQEWAQYTFGYYWIATKPTKEVHPSIQAIFDQWPGFRFEVYAADVGGDPYEYNSWTDEHLCLMFAPNGYEIGQVDPFSLKTARKIHDALLYAERKN